MDTELVSLNDVDIEEGELSDTSEEVYTPLQRPAMLTQPTIQEKVQTNLAKISKMDAEAVDEIKIINDPDEDECQSDDFSTSSDDSSDTCLDKTKKQKKPKHKSHRVKRTIMVRVSATADEKRACFKKYDIWTAALQEEALTENMRGCDVTQTGFNDRNVENYDFSLRYRLNGENSLKRRLSNSNDDQSDSDQHLSHSKRQRASSRDDVKSNCTKRSVQDRLGKRREFRGRRRPSFCSGSDSNSYEKKHIEDLENAEGRSAIEIAREMALKLHEEKYDLLVRAVEVLGTELPLKIYRETQRIESEGGMTIKNGQRRRTPGGVFLFLLKHDESLSAEDEKAIFSEDRNNANKKHKNMKAIMRDRKVEELKKRLCKRGTELPNLNTRKELMLVSDEINKKLTDGNLSNPPPSPEVYEHRGLDLKSMPINHVSNDVDSNVSDKPSTSQGIEETLLKIYKDDFLEVNYADMDLF